MISGKVRKFEMKASTNRKIVSNTASRYDINYKATRDARLALQ